MRLQMNNIHLNSGEKWIFLTLKNILKENKHAWYKKKNIASFPGDFYEKF